MATITTRAGKGTPLTNNEVDDNFTNLNTDKAELSGATFTGNVGIGTSPARALHVEGGNDTIRLQSTGSNTKIEMVNTGSTTNEFGFLSNNFFVAPDGSEALRIDSSGNVLVGKTSDDNTANGLVVSSNGYTKIVRTSGTANANSVLMLNRQSTDGSIAEFRKDDAVVGSIGTSGGEIYIAHDGTTDTGLRFRGNGTIIPVNSNGTGANGTQDLGASLYRFKDIHLSGTGYFGTSVGIGTTSPSGKLEVSSADFDTLYLTRSTAGSATILMKNSSNNGGLVQSLGNGGLSFFSTVSDSSSERMRIDSSGNLLVGKTSDLISSVGGTIGAAGYITATRDGSAPLSANRLTSDGALVNLYKDGSTVGSVGVSGSRPYLSNGVNDGIKIADDYVAPCNQTGADKDASLDLGSSSVRFKDIYRSGSTYSTSDRNKKQDIRDLTDAEARVATVAKGSLKAFRYIDSVEAEGDEANIHFGIIAQDLKAAFEAEGLNANDYQVFKTSTYTDDDGVEQTTYSVCYENLLAFIIAAI